MEHVCKGLEVSQRRACKVLSQPRGTQRYRPRRVDEDRALAAAMKRLSRMHPRYGYRRITVLLRSEGWSVNRKRAYRLWRQEGLKVPGKKGKRKRLGDSENSCIRRRAEHVNHVWSYDFVSDQTEDGRRLKMLVILDEYTRESLTIEVERRIKAHEVLASLAYLFAVRGASTIHSQRQRAGIRGRSDPDVAHDLGGPDAVHRPGQPLGERVHRVVQQPLAG